MTDAAPEPSAERCLGLGVGRLWRRLDARFERAFAAYDLSHAQAQVLLALVEAGPLAVHELAHRTGFQESTVSRLVKRLAAERFVLVRPDPGDGRMRRVKAAARTRHLADALHDTRERVNRTLQRGLDEADLEAFRRVARRLDGAR